MHPMSMIAHPGGGVPEWTVADRLRKARESASLSQKQLADRSDISLRTVANYESPTYAGARKRPFLASWAMATGVPLSWILTGAVSDDGPGGQVITSSRWMRRQAAAA